MKQVEIVEAILRTSRVDTDNKDYTMLRAMAVGTVADRCATAGTKELPDRDASELISTTKTMQLYLRYINQCLDLRSLLWSKVEHTDRNISKPPGEEDIKLKNALMNALAYVERIAVLAKYEPDSAIAEGDFNRLGLHDAPTVKRFLVLCPLIELRDGRYFFKNPQIMTALYVNASTEHIVGNRITSVTRDSKDAKVYFPTSRQSGGRLILAVSGGVVHPPSTATVTDMRALDPTPVNSLNPEQITKIQGRIDTLKREKDERFSLNSGRKQQKIEALEALLLACSQGEDLKESIEIAIDAPGVKKGWRNRTEALLNELLSEIPASGVRPR